MQKYHNSRAKQSLVSPKLFRNYFLQYYIQSELIDKYSQITELTQLYSFEQVLHIKSVLLLQSLYPIWYVKCTLKPLFI